MLPVSPGCADAATQDKCLICQHALIVTGVGSDGVKKKQPMSIQCVVQKHDGDRSDEIVLLVKFCDAECANAFCLKPDVLLHLYLYPPYLRIFG